MNQPRLITRSEAALYCGLTTSGFSDWVKRGVLPTPIPGTARWDKRAIDAKLDKLSGIKQLTTDTENNDFDEMEAAIDARIAQRRSQSKKKAR